MLKHKTLARRMAALAALLCALALAWGALAEGPMDFTGWLNGDAAPAASAPAAAAPEIQVEVEAQPEAPQAEAIEAQPEAPQAEPIEAQPEAPQAEAIEAQPEAPQAEAIETQPEAPVPAAVEAVQSPFGPEPTLEPPQPLRSARIRAVGDLMVHKKQLAVAKRSDGSYDFHDQYALIAGSLADADYTLANLETTVGRYRSLDYSGYPMFNTPESLLETVKDAGVDFLTLANNHMLDRYFEGLMNTVSWVEQYGFDFGGANRSPEERNAAKVVYVNGIGIGLLCYTQMTNGMESYCNSAVEEYAVNYLRKADFAADVQRLRDAGADVVIALPHWGEEYRRKPEPNTVALAKLMIASGVDVILGSHPHMVQPVEFVEAQTPEGGTRTGLVAYSLGNFISNMSVRHTDSGIILQFTVQERQDGSFGIDDVCCVPVYCWRSAANVQPLSSLKYLDNPPRDMDAAARRRMAQSYQELRDLLDDSILLLAE